MKTIINISVSILLFGIILSGCHSPGWDTMIKDETQRSEMIKTIISNHEYMTELMDAIHENEHAMQMMQGDKAMMRNMLEYKNFKNMLHTDDVILHNTIDHLVKVAANDTVICRDLMDNLMQEPGMHEMMMSSMSNAEGVPGKHHHRH